MPVKILLPALSPTMTEGTLAKWLKKEGEEVHSGDIVAEVETDKATMEIEAIEDGKLGRILIAEGTEGVPINTPIALSILFEVAKHINNERENDPGQAGALAQLLRKLGGYIGILECDAEVFFKQGVSLSDAEIDGKICQRDDARAAKDFAMSDQIRDELMALDIILEDGSNGTTWRRK